MPVVHDDDDEFEADHHDREDPDPDDHDREAPDPDDMDDESDSHALMGTIDCPYCSKEIAEESPWCPHCGNYISKEDSPAMRKPVWFVVTLVLVILILLSWIIFRS